MIQTVFLVKMLIAVLALDFVFHFKFQCKLILDTARYLFYFESHCNNLKGRNCLKITSFSSYHLDKLPQRFRFDSHQFSFYGFAESFIVTLDMLIQQTISLPNSMKFFLQIRRNKSFRSQN